MLEAEAIKNDFSKISCFVHDEILSYTQRTKYMRSCSISITLLEFDDLYIYVIYNSSKLCNLFF